MSDDSVLEISRHDHSADYVYRRSYPADSPGPVPQFFG